MDFKLINVGIADYGIATSPDILRTILGSCIGICLFDEGNKLGGLSHIMLPLKKSEEAPKKKYADTAIPMMLKEMIEQGAEQDKVTAKIIGGSNMFSIAKKNYLMGDIGRKNIITVKDVLHEMNIKIVSEDIGGDYGRTIDFYLETGMIKVKSHGREVKLI